MALTKNQRIQIEELTKHILISRIESFPDETTQIRNAPFHEQFLETFKNQLKPLKINIPHLVALSSWLHGLNTSLGSGFEQLAHILSGGYKRSFSRNFILKVKKTQSENIEQITRDLKEGSKKPDLLRENNIIFNYSMKDNDINCLAFTVDNYTEGTDLIEAIELKSVRPNSGEAKGEKQKILYGKAAFKVIEPKKHINYFIAFPFDPTGKDAVDFNKSRFFDYLVEFKKFFAPDEVLLGAEFWNHLNNGKHTMEEILEIIKNVVRKI